MLCVVSCRAGLRKCLSISCDACMLGGLPSVVLTHRSFDIAYSYWYLKGCYLKLESSQLCVGCGRRYRASWCGYYVTVIWHGVGQESTWVLRVRVEDLNQYKLSGSPAKATPLSVIVKRSHKKTKTNDALVDQYFPPSLYFVCGTQPQAHWFLLKM